MTALRTATTHRPTARPDVATAAHGARWITASVVVVGVVNYGYALLLTRLLDVGSYAVFAAGAGLLLSAVTVARVTIPWVLAQALARAGSDAERSDATRFAIITSTGAGFVAAGIVAGVAIGFAGPATTLALALTTFCCYVTSVPVGRLQGEERMRTLSLLGVAEVVLKTMIGVALVLVLGLSDTGALAAFGVALLPFLLWWPALRRGAGRAWQSASANRDLWRRAFGIARVQGLVALMVAIDVVLVTVLPADRAAAASYQSSVTLSRVPLFVASAVSIAFFPALSRRLVDSSLSASAVRMYVIASLPLAVTVATAPAAVLTTIFPAGYSMMSALIAFTAITGFALGTINLIVTFFQAADDYACARHQVVGLVGYTLSLLAGWQIGGVRGMAIGGAVGGVGALALLVHRLVRSRGTAPLSRMPLLEPLLLAGVLVLLHPYPLAWLIAATVIGLRTVERFLRRTNAHGPAEEPPVELTTHQSGTAMIHASAEHSKVRTSGTEVRPGRLLVDAVWRETPRPAGDAALRRALPLARDNQVEGRLARAYPRQLADVVAEVDTANELFRENLGEVTDRLRAAGIPTVLIKRGRENGHACGDFDLVVPDGRWQAACDVLQGWYVDRSTYWLERSTKVLLEPRRGPSVHLHTGVSWFGVPVMSTRRLFDRACPDAGAWLAPHPADELRIWLAHGLFQNLSLDLSELVALRDLLLPDLVEDARREAAREGWLTGCARALVVADEAIGELDRGTLIRLPVPLPATASLRVGAEHALHLLRNGRTTVAAREAALRVPLVVAKSRGRFA
ncbi:lipopolysaccharide biosynthesis protein [Streptomyces olindensis]|uniref:lipopolysaccharide biosynthesis protein n=1 Tax=Streptomyces olindensis TaxID=358823 RepID=UPI0033F598D8